MVCILDAAPAPHRPRRRRVAVVSDLLSMVSVALVPILSAGLDLDFWLLAGLAVLVAVFVPISFMPARSRLLLRGG